MLKQNLQQKLGLKINPLQIQFIKLLELPTLQLEQKIKEELEENPLLEEGMPEEENEEEAPIDQSVDENEPEEKELEKEEKEEILEDFIDDDDIPDYKLQTSNRSKDDEAREYIISQKTTFRENLLHQLGIRDLSAKQKKIAEYIIGNLDDDGYLRRNLENIVDDLSFVAGLEITEKEVESLLKIIQELEPAGVGARDLQECLLLQIKRKKARGAGDENVQHAEWILRDCFDEFSKKHYERMAQKLKLSDDGLKKVIDEILKLNPRPGNSEGDLLYENIAVKITPDFMLELIDGELQLSLNSEHIPDLRVNNSYLHLLGKQRETLNVKAQKEVSSFIKYKLNSAKLFIDAIRQRNTTLMLTMTAIIQLQKAFFLSGDRSLMKPMILKDVADITGLDVSTLSRVSNSKYIQTWFGVFALKEFFSGSMQNTSGEEVSTGEIKDALKQLIDAEDKKNPYTDDELVDLMQEKGYKIARRTIAKYRQMFDIPVARLRRLI